MARLLPVLAPGSAVFTGGVTMASLAMFTVAFIQGEGTSNAMDERSVFSWYSFGLLMAVSVVSLIIFRVRSRQESDRHWRASYWIWLIIGLGFIYLGVDEAIEIHEHLDKDIHRLLLRWYGFHETPLSDRLDDAIVGLYGLIGAGFIWLYRREFLAYRGALPFLGVAFLLLVAMVALDMMSNQPDWFYALFGETEAVVRVYKATSAFEELFKVLAESVFLAGFYHCLVASVRGVRQSANPVAVRLTPARRQTAPARSGK